MRTLHLPLALLLALSPAIASAGLAPRDAQAKMDVTGTVEVAADGTLVSHTIDQPGRIDPKVLGLIERDIAQWRFQPVPSGQKARMSLVLHGQPDGHDSYDIKVASVVFNDMDAGPAGRWSPTKMGPPKYPRAALLAGTGGTVYLYLHMDRSGKVGDVWVSEVDLDTPYQPDHWAKILGDASAMSASQWRLQPPPDVDRLPDSSLVVMVPVNFSTRVAIDEYGHWVTYFPGAHQSAPWMTQPEPAFMKHPEALASNRIYSINHDVLELKSGPGAD